MVAFAPATHKLVTASGANLSTAAPVDGRIALTKIMQSLGLADVQFGTSSPGDNTKLWYDTSNNTLKRYDPVAGSWLALTEAQFSLWLAKRTTLSASSLSSAASNDTINIYDTSAGETKKITVENLVSNQWIGPVNSAELTAGAYKIEAWSTSAPAGGNDPTLLIEGVDLVYAGAAPQLSMNYCFLSGFVDFRSGRAFASATVYEQHIAENGRSRHTHYGTKLSQAVVGTLLVSSTTMHFRYMRLSA